MENQDYRMFMANVVELRDAYQNGQITLEGVASEASDIAFQSDAVGEMETIVTALVFQLVTGKEYNDDDWA